MILINGFEIHNEWQICFQIFIMGLEKKRRAGRLLQAVARLK